MTPSGGNHTSSAAINYIFHHVFLPPEVPQQDDFNWEYEVQLLNIVSDTLAELKGLVYNDDSISLREILHNPASIDLAAGAVCNMRTLHGPSKDTCVLNPGALQIALQDLSDSGKCMSSRLEELL